MSRISCLATALLATLLSVIPAYAQGGIPTIGAASETVGGPLTGIASGEFFVTIAEFLIVNAIPFLNVIAGVTIVVAGILAVIAQDENRINNTRNVVASAIVAIILVNGASAIGSTLWGEFGYIGGSGGEGRTFLEEEILGLLSWIEQPVLILALLTITISGIRTVVSFGGEQGITQLRNTIASVIFGILLIMAKIAISKAVVIDRTATRLNQIGINITKTVVGYMGLFAVIMIVIAGLYMVVNIGNEEQYTKGKNLLMRVVIGLVVIVVASALALLIIDNLVT